MFADFFVGSLLGIEGLAKEIVFRYEVCLRYSCEVSVLIFSEVFRYSSEVPVLFFIEVGFSSLRDREADKGEESEDQNFFEHGCKLFIFKLDLIDSM